MNRALTDLLRAHARGRPGVTLDSLRRRLFGTAGIHAFPRRPHYDLIMTAPPDEVSDLYHRDHQHHYRAYPISDHIADKVCAMIEFHHRADGQPQPSSRYHDLADLATFARTTVVDAQALIRALRSEAGRRGLQLPDRLTIPDPTWDPGYARVAGDTHASSIGTWPRCSEPQLRSLIQLWL